MVLFKQKKINSNQTTVIPCTEMHALKSKLLGNRCTIKHAFRHIFIRIQVEYTEHYIDIQGEF